MKKWVLIFGALLPIYAFADDCCNDECTCHWALTDITDEISGEKVYIDKAKTIPAQQLTITGTGAIKDYTRTGENIAPWKNPDHSGGNANAAPTISQIVIEKGITSIGEHAFEDIDSVTAVSLPEGLKSIERQAFDWCNHLSQINLPNSIEKLGAYAFYATKISSIELPENLKTIGTRALGNTKYLSNITIPEGTNVSAIAFETEVTAGSKVYIQNIYCSGNNVSCQALKNKESMAGKVQFYYSDQDAYFYDNRWYALPNDIIGGNHIIKRIYTIDEANKVAGKTNRVSIRYK